MKPIEPESEQGENVLPEEIPGYQKLSGTITALDPSHGILVLAPEGADADVKLTAPQTFLSGLHVGNQVTVEAIGAEIRTIDVR